MCATANMYWLCVCVYFLASKTSTKMKSTGIPAVPSLHCAEVVHVRTCMRLAIETTTQSHRKPNIKSVSLCEASEQLSNAERCQHIQRPRANSTAICNGRGLSPSTCIHTKFAWPLHLCINLIQVVRSQSPAHSGVLFIAFSVWRQQQHTPK